MLDCKNSNKDKKKDFKKEIPNIGSLKTPRLLGTISKILVRRLIG